MKKTLKPMIVTNFKNTFFVFLNKAWQWLEESNMIRII